MARPAINGHKTKAAAAQPLGTKANGVATEARGVGDCAAAAAEGSEKAKQWYAAGSVGDRSAKVIEALRETTNWYGEPRQVQAFMDLALRVASSAPAKAYELCGALVHGFARLDLSKQTEGSVITVGDQSFKSRSELKTHFKKILERYPEDGMKLDTEDQSFIRELLVYHPNGAEKVQKCMAIAVGRHHKNKARCFCVLSEGAEPDDFSYVRCVDNTPTRDSHAADRMCEVLVEVLKMHPTAISSVVNLLEERFPFHQAGNVEFHSNYVRSLLQICTHLPAVTCYLLRVLICKMCLVDVQIAKKVDAIEDKEIADEDVDRMSQVLDAMMMKVLEFLEQKLRMREPGREPGDDENALVKSLLGIFETHVLITYRSRYIQFLFFYISSLKPRWLEDFLTLLLQILYNVQASPVKRRMAAAYLGSFVCRASFATIRYTLQTTKYLVSFAREQLNSKELHREATWQLIVSVVQAIAYILCFKAAEFAEANVEEAGGRNCLEDLLSPGDDEGFVAVLRDPARPFQAIIPRVAEECRRALRHYAPNLVDEAMLLVGDSQNSIVEMEEMDSAFPFDPYNLRSSHIFLMGIYKDWRSVNQVRGDMMLDEDEDEDSETEQESGVDDNERTQGFAGRVDKPIRKVSAFSSEDSESHDDFIDAADVELRGFIPSCGPSPAFCPRKFPANGPGSASVEFSPMPVPMEMGDEDEDSFSLPGPSVPEDECHSRFLDSMLNNAAYNSPSNEKRSRPRHSSDMSMNGYPGI